MKLQNFFHPILKIGKSLIKKGIRICMRTCPDSFKKGILPVKFEEAENVLGEIYPDIGSSCWCENRLDTNPEYDLHIIISAYNVERYINQCVDSILSQKTDYKYHVTIVNDGSKDSTRNRLLRYENLPNIEIIDQENKGYSGARNVALKNIKGRYVMFVDSDDYLEEGALETLMKKGLADNADIVQGSFNHVDAENTIIRREHLKEEKSVRLENIMIKSQPWAKIFKAKLFQNIHFPEGYWYEDTIVRFIIVPNSNLKITTSKIVYNYRHHSGTVIKQNKNPLKEIDALYVTRSVLKDYMNQCQINEYIHDHFLHQGTFINSRMKYVDDLKIRQYVFCVICNIYHQNFKHFGYKSRKFPVMQKALEERDYGLYRMACKYYT